MNVLTHYFKENRTEDLIKVIVWEGHKAVVRGELVSLGSKRKKSRQADLQRVLYALQQTEFQHKHGGDPETELFLRLLDLQALSQLRYMFHKYYEQSNKCGQILARAL